MSYAIAAAGTGGHVYPGLAVGEALVAGGVGRDEILFIGGDRLESHVYPGAGFPFLGAPLRGLRRGLGRSDLVANLGIPRVVAAATRAMKDELALRGARVLLGLGGYVTVPAALAARRIGAAVAVAEQNAEAGLANRLAGRLAARRFGSFPHTKGLHAEWVGNPVRSQIAAFDREALRPAALVRYGLDSSIPVVGVFGGSLGAGALNAAVERMVGAWSGSPVQILHLAGESHAAALRERAASARLRWIVIGFEERMDAFYAASDLVIARAGGAVAELSATATPAVLVPGAFGSGRHQLANATALAAVGSATVLPEDELDDLGDAVVDLLGRPERRAAMAAAAARLARPSAARDIAAVLREMHDGR